MALTEHHKSYLDHALPVPAREQHLLLFKDYRAALASGDRERASRLEGELVQRNLGLAHQAALKYWRAHGMRNDFDDVLAVAVEGLLAGIRKFDHTRGVAPSTFLIWWCRQAAQRHCADKGYAIHVPSYLQARPEGRALRDRLNNTIRLDARVRSKQGELERDVADVVPGDTIPADEIVVHRERHDRVLALLGRLEDERDRVIIEMRFGLGPDGTEYTLEEIGELLDLSRERIRQREARAMRRLAEGHVE